MADDFRFQVNLRGVIDLLSEHLYSGPHVYLREMLQNAVDAITARQRLDPAHVGEIKLELVAPGSNHPPTLAVHDNGVGLSESEIHEFLATIGQSSKRGELLREEFLGQFGIGLLSGFVVSEEIVVITRTACEEAPAVEWRGRSDGTYSVRRLEREIAPGTQVYLRAKPGCGEYFDPSYIEAKARHYGSLLPFPIEVIAGSRRTPVNETPPWRARFPTAQAQREALLAYGEQLFDTAFFDAIPLHSEAGAIEGVALVLPHSAGNSRKRTHRVYLKNMLLSERVENLLPDWAFFVTCVVNASDLRPTASREAFYEDERLAAAREALGGCLRDYLVHLARTDRQRLDRLIDLHYLAIKALAVEDDAFYRIFVDWLPFETSMGPMTLGEYRREYGVVRYTPTRDQFRQIAGVASAQSLCVVNGGYAYDMELLEKLPRVFAEAEVERIEAADLAQNFDDLSLEEREEVFELVRLADLVLQPFKCAVQVKKFEPADLPTLYTADDSAAFLRSVERSKDVADDLWSGVLDRIADGMPADQYAQLCLNYRNPLVRRIAKLADRKLAGRAVEMLYVQALLLGHHPLRAKEMSLLNSGLLGLIDYGVSAGEQRRDN